MGPKEAQLERVRERYTVNAVLDLPGVGTIVSVSEIALPAGWNKAATDISFLVPEGYPFAKPDCFWADQDLRLANGLLPQNAQLQALPGGGSENYLWFSWHVDPWNPNRDDLNSWLAVIRRRLALPQ